MAKAQGKENPAAFLDSYPKGQDGKIHLFVASENEKFQAQAKTMGFDVSEKDVSQAARFIKMNEGKGVENPYGNRVMVDPGKLEVTEKNASAIKAVMDLGSKAYEGFQATKGQGQEKTQTKERTQAKTSTKGQAKGQAKGKAPQAKGGKQQADKQAAEISAWVGKEIAGRATAKGQLNLYIMTPNSPEKDDSMVRRTSSFLKDAKESDSIAFWKGNHVRVDLTKFNPSKGEKAHDAVNAVLKDGSDRFTQSQANLQKQRAQSQGKGR